MFIDLHLERYFETAAFAGLLGAILGFCVGRWCKGRLQARLLLALFLMPPIFATLGLLIASLQGVTVHIGALLAAVLFAQLLCFVGYVITWAFTLSGFLLGEWLQRRASRARPASLPANAPGEPYKPNG